MHHCAGLLSHVLQAHAAGRRVHRAVPELCGDPAAAGDRVQAEPVPVFRQGHRRVPAQQGAHGQAVLRRRRRVPRRRGRHEVAAAGRPQVGRPEEPEEAPAAHVRPGPGPGRGGNDVGRPGTPAGWPEPVQRDRRGRRRRPPKHRHRGLRPGRPSAAAGRRRAARRDRSPSHAVPVAALRVMSAVQRVHCSRAYSLA